MISDIKLFLSLEEITPWGKIRLNLQNIPINKLDINAD